MLDDLTQVTLEVEGGRACLTLNRPEQLNALSPTLIDEALRASEHVAGLRAVRALVVTGAGRAFSAGVDLKAVGSPGYDRERFSANARKLVETWERMPQATIARVAGYCFTGGLEIALGCDFIVCSEESQFADTHAKLGFRPGWGLSARLPRRIGVQRAKEMSFTARRVGAREAKEMGLVLDAVPADRLDARVGELVEAIAAMSAGSIAAYKALYRHSQNMTLDELVAHEATAHYPIEDRAARQAATTGDLGASKRARA